MFNVVSSFADSFIGIGCIGRGSATVNPELGSKGLVVTGTDSLVILAILNLTNAFQYDKGRLWIGIEEYNSTKFFANFLIKITTHRSKIYKNIKIE